MESPDEYLGRFFKIVCPKNRYEIICLFLRLCLLCTDRNLTVKEQVYNYRHSRARRVIENAFGVLAARWRILGRPVECLPDKVGDVVKACVALHNYLAYTDAADAPTARYIPANFIDSANVSGELLREWRRQVEGDGNLQDPGRLSGARASRAAHITRKDFSEFFQ